MNAVRRYTQTQAETASPERTMVLLFEAALRDIRLGSVSLEAGKRSEAAALFGKASEIVMALHGALDHPQAPELCGQLAGLYVFVATRLVRASAAADLLAARDAERTLTPIVEAFRTAVAAQQAAP
ncbi:flagellar export chaperone FliS [Vulgatibacter sp.]|uniref:flagellar export chaperone FliS n=1 Tax=Vulgatibacter sp. TaxID=1971226 RepID=UPI00356A99B8